MKEKIIKHINAILCAINVIALALPFSGVDVSASAFGVSGGSSQSISGFKMITDSGMWGFLFALGMVAILATTYIGKLAGYKKIACLASSAIMIISLFLAPGNLSAGGGAEGVSVDIDISYGVGFYIILVSTVLILGIALVRFLELKGNVVFDLINGEEENLIREESSVNAENAMPNPNAVLGAATEKIGNVTKNLTESVTQQAGSIMEKAKEAAQTKTAAQPRYNSDHVMEQINKLFEMKEKGVLTEEEFTQKKAEFLNKLQ
ncbi:MAG: SHOCT domain-containing protein [Clostridia bacterium]|nr:SHOCT domain-containing protein [Clostridia bacterium]